MHVEISVLPVSEDADVTRYLAEVAKIIKAADLDFHITPMSVIVAAPKDTVLSTLKNCHQAIMNMTDRAMIKVRMDEIKGQNPGLRETIQAIQGSAESK